MDAAPSPTALIAVRDRREAVIQRLSDSFATDLLDVDEFEDRLSRAHAAHTIAALDALLDGLAPLPAAATSTAMVPLSVHTGLSIPRENIRATFGNIERHGAWAVPAALSARATFGNVVLDFREARFTAGVTELDAHAAFGNLEILVPPQLAVDCQGGSLFGNFESHGVNTSVPDPERPLLRIRGRAVFGNIEVHARLPGETERAAQRRLGPARG
jgi:hypothetical protein